MTRQADPSPASTMLAAGSADLPTELCRRAVAHIALTAHAAAAAQGVAPGLDDGELLSMLADLLALVLQRLLRQAGSASMHANRVHLNIFDILRVVPALRMGVADLINFLLLTQAAPSVALPSPPPAVAHHRLGGGGRPGRGGGGTGPAILPPGRSLLRARGDDEDDDDDGGDDDEDQREETEGGGGGGESGDQRRRMGPRHEPAPRPAYLTDIYPPLPRSYTFRHTETRGVREGDKVLQAKLRAEQQRQVESNLYRLLAKTNALPEFVNCEEDL